MNPEPEQARPTKGPCYISRANQVWCDLPNGSDARIADADVTDRLSTSEKSANARLIAEAGTVFDRTGLGPEQLAAERDALMVALKASYSLLSMLPSREFWNGADAADSFDGRYGRQMREKFDAAWTSAESAIAMCEPKGEA